MRSVVCIAMLAIMPLGCVAYRVPQLPPIQERPGPHQRVFIVLNPPAKLDLDAHYLNRWGQAASFAASLEEAGFSPAIVPHATDVPGDTPLIENFAFGYNQRGDCFRSLPLSALSFLSLGVIPHFDCSNHGHSFDVRPAPGAPAQRIDTEFSVPVVVGWLVPPLFLFPQFSADVPPNTLHDRERRALQAALLDALGGG